MKKRLSPYFRSVLSAMLIAIFSVFVFGQGPVIGRTESETELFVRVMGWILISGAAISHITANVYAVVKGKNYEQLKEAAANYKELADSRRAQIAELRAEKAELETECENLKERILRLPG